MNKQKNNVQIIIKTISESFSFTGFDQLAIMKDAVFNRLYDDDHGAFLHTDKAGYSIFIASILSSCYEYGNPYDMENYRYGRFCVDSQELDGYLRIRIQTDPNKFPYICILDLVNERADMSKKVSWIVGKWHHIWVSDIEQ